MYWPPQAPPAPPRSAARSWSGYYTSYPWAFRTAEWCHLLTEIAKSLLSSCRICSYSMSCCTAAHSHYFCARTPVHSDYTPLQSRGCLPLSEPGLKLCTRSWEPTLLNSPDCHSIPSQLILMVQMWPSTDTHFWNLWPYKSPLYPGTTRLKCSWMVRKELLCSRRLYLSFDTLFVNFLRNKKWMANSRLKTDKHLRRLSNFFFI